MTHLVEVVGPAVWTGEDLREQDWLTVLDNAAIREIHELTAMLSAGGKRVNDLDLCDFQSIRSALWVQAARRRLQGGPGFVILRGLGAFEGSLEDAKIAYWGIGSVFGIPRVQNLEGDRIHVVADVENLCPGNTAPGGSTSNNEILAHTENARPPYPPWLICLMCLAQGAIGGESLLYSGYELHNRVLRRRPDLIPRLYQDFVFGRHAEDYPDGRRWDSWPVFRIVGGHLSIRYGRYWLDAAERESGIDMDPLAREAADVIDSILADNRMPVQFKLQPGDILIVDNHKVLHARAAFVDGPPPQSRRRLLRLWLDQG